MDRGLAEALKERFDASLEEQDKAAERIISFLKTDGGCYTYGELDEAVKNLARDLGDYCQPMIDCYLPIEKAIKRLIDEEKRAIAVQPPQTTEDQSLFSTLTTAEEL